MHAPHPAHLLPASSSWASFEATAAGVHPWSGCGPTTCMGACGSKLTSTPSQQLQPTAVHMTGPSCNMPCWQCTGFLTAASSCVETHSMCRARMVGPRNSSHSCNRTHLSGVAGITCCATQLKGAAVPHKLTCCMSSSAHRNALHTSGRQMPVLHIKEEATSSAPGSILYRIYI